MEELKRARGLVERAVELTPGLWAGPGRDVQAEWLAEIREGLRQMGAGPLLLTRKPRGVVDPCPYPMQEALSAVREAGRLVRRHGGSGDAAFATRQDLVFLEGYLEWFAEQEERGASRPAPAGGQGRAPAPAASSPAGRGAGGGCLCCLSKSHAALFRALADFVQGGCSCGK